MRTPPIAILEDSKFIYFNSAAKTLVETFPTGNISLQQFNCKRISKQQRCNDDHSTIDKNLAPINATYKSFSSASAYLSLSLTQFQADYNVKSMKIHSFLLFRAVVLRKILQVFRFVSISPNSIVRNIFVNYILSWRGWAKTSEINIFCAIAILLDTLMPTGDFRLK